MSIFAHKLRQFYECYLIASFLFFKSPQVIFSAKAANGLTSFRSSFLDYRPRTGYSISQHTASQPRLPTARLSFLCISISIVRITMSAVLVGKNVTPCND